MTTQQTIEKAVTWALQIAQDSSHGYDQIHRWGPDYDCSAFLITAWQRAGVSVKAAEVNLNIGAGLQRGDVLLNIQHHTAMSIGSGRIVHASINENGKAAGGKTGDQTGREICVRSYYKYSKGWDKVLRYVGSGKKEEVTQVKQYAGIVKVSSYLNVRLGPSAPICKSSR